MEQENVWEHPMRTKREEETFEQSQKSCHSNKGELSDQGTYEGDESTDGEGKHPMEVAS